MTPVTRPKARITFEEVETKRRAFARALKTFTAQNGRYHDRAPELAPEKLSGCEVLPSRLALLDRLTPSGIFAEVGVDRGDFSVEILTRCKPARLHLFDIDISRITNPVILDALEQPESPISLHPGDSASTLSRLNDNYFDVIYIDGDHSFEGVMRDINAALPRLKPEGALIFNDYNVWSPVSMMHCGVARAVHEFCRDHPWKFRYIALQSMMYNDVMLVRE